MLARFVDGLGAVFQNLRLTCPVPQIICSFSCHSSPVFILLELTVGTHHKYVPHHVLYMCAHFHTGKKCILSQSQAGPVELARQPI